MNAATPLIELRHIGFDAQNDTILNDFSYGFRQGVATALYGAAGSGKSSVLKIAAGLLVPTRGEVLYNGKDIATMNKHENLAFHRACGFVFQDSALWANQSLYDTLALPVRLHFPAMSEEVRRALVVRAARDVGYEKDLDARPDKLSMGEQKLIAFARATICHPDTLFLDEWVESVSEELANRLIAIVRDYKDAGRTIIFVTHDPRIVDMLADVVVTLHRGALHAVRVRPPPLGQWPRTSRL
jgi:ABC-type lipoprotein export system ATPase subunit